MYIFFHSLPYIPHSYTIYSHIIFGAPLCGVPSPLSHPNGAGTLHISTYRFRFFSVGVSEKSRVFLTLPV